MTAKITGMATRPHVHRSVLQTITWLAQRMVDVGAHRRELRTFIVHDWGTSLEPLLQRYKLKLKKPPGLSDAAHGRAMGQLEALACMVQCVSQKLSADDTHVTHTGKGASVRKREDEQEQLRALVKAHGIPMRVVSAGSDVYMFPKPFSRSRPYEGVLLYVGLPKRRTTKLASALLKKAPMGYFVSETRSIKEALDAIRWAYRIALA